MFKWFAAAAFAALSLLEGTASAATTEYDCTFQTGATRDGGWIPQVLVLQHNDKTGEIIVFDPVIRHFVGKPIPAIQTEQTRVRTSFTWTIETSRKGGARGSQSAAMQYKFSYFNNGQPARVLALPTGYDNRFSGEGTCKLKKG